VLNASGRADAGPERPAAGGSKSTAAFIPVPNAAGVVENYDELYPPTKWTDPESYLRASDSVDEAISAALNGGFTYYMDEQDKEWLDRNNEEARGEGTSAQGSVTSSGGTRSSQRSAKAKGKDPECMAPITVSEDEFELIMGVFEKAAHDKTEFLHHVSNFTSIVPCIVFISYTGPEKWNGFSSVHRLPGYFQY
jgi:enhancer of polycomb-like protein